MRPRWWASVSRFRDSVQGIVQGGRLPVEAGRALCAIGMGRLGGRENRYGSCASG